ncbi:MAG: TIGR03960 family B12-binding radical SAM protein [Desulfobacteraceae bacterium]|nr:TIGR03960 family B12-binding radical SAM protein [Desulfobacteraceae bacterium]
MQKENFQELLSLCEMPSRYLGHETNAQKKDLSKVDLKYALCFPDLHEIGTSYFGAQILYHILNKEKNIAAERFFTPAPDMEQLLKERNIPLLSMESMVDLASFDIIGMSLLYELNFTNILTMLDLSGIPFLSEKRDASYPLIIAGGPCAFNPEPVADFFDAIVIGDGEEVVLEIAKKYIKWKKDGDGRKESILDLLSEIEGVYVPRFFKPLYDQDKIQRLEPLKQGYTKVKRAILAKFDSDSFPVAPIVPFGKPVHDRLRLEVARGCSKGCRFCQAGMIYRPVRERPVKSLLKIAKESSKNTGYKDVSLLSLSTGDYSCLDYLMENILTINENHLTSISLPSIRAEKLTPNIMEIIKKVRKTGFTIAPEAGSQRLRNIINKNITEQEIFDAVKNAFDLGWRNIKLYFMMGLPFETDEDIEKIVDLSHRLADIKTKHNAKVSVSVANFIPKSHTPFQRSGQISNKEAKEKLQYLKENLKHFKTKLKWQDPNMSLLEGVFARGDRKLSSLLIKAWENGCRLDGWTDKFRYDLWEKAFEQTGIDPLFYTTRIRKHDEILPWDHIDSGVSAKFFEKEFEKAENGEITEDCRDIDCTGCGICDFENIKPVIGSSHIIKQEEKKNSIDIEKEIVFQKYKIFYSKLKSVKYIGHLEFAKIIRRAIRKAGIKVKYTKGFNPNIKLSFDNPIPVGMESEQEFFILFVDSALQKDQIKSKLNLSLPPGIFITDISLFSKKDQDFGDISRYKIVFNDYKITQEDIDNFMALSEWPVEAFNKKGKKIIIDLRQVVEAVELFNQVGIEMVLKKYKEKTVRPSEILLKCFKVSKETVQTARIVKLKQDV